MNSNEVILRLVDLAHDLNLNWMQWYDAIEQTEVIRFEKNCPFEDDEYIFGNPSKQSVMCRLDPKRKYTNTDVCKIMTTVVNTFSEPNARTIPKRPSKDEYYLGIAQAVAKRSTCIRRQYGAVIVKDDRIISTGYNGSARGKDNCCDKGVCWREQNHIPHGEQYEKCQAVHAEANAIINGNPSDMIGATLYLAGFEDGKLIEEPKPCMMCERLITNARIEKVINKF